MENKLSSDVNHFPSITWHHLHINHGHFEGAIDSQIDFKSENLSDIVEIKKISPKECPLPVEFENQMGKDFNQQIDQAEKEFQVNFIRIPKGISVEKVLKFVFDVDTNKNQASETVIFAEEATDIQIVFEYSGQGEGCGVFGHRIKVYCAPCSRVGLSTANLLPKNMLHYNGIAVFQEENSSFTLNQIDLGAKEVVTGSFITLNGSKAESTVHGAYFSNNQNYDVNYIVQHKSRDTKSTCFYNGIVDGSGKKSWRGTIDFVKGCVDSTGDEQENVLLLDPNVVNKSMPVILCGEEEVDGRHGSSIGRLNDEELLYLETRGINKTEARSIMIRSKINAMSRFVPDESVKEKIQNFLEESL